MIQTSLIVVDSGRGVLIQLILFLVFPVTLQMIQTLFSMSVLIIIATLAVVEQIVSLVVIQHLALQLLARTLLS